MHTLKFRSKEFTRMIQHMLKNERKIPYVDETTDEYGLWLVKDEGIYVMSPSPERDIVSKNKCHVIYARGYSPRVKDLWEKTHAVSGDDFAEFIPLDERQVIRLENGGDMTIRLSETQLEIRA